MNNRKRPYCFTINNFNEGEVENLKKIDCKYIVFGMEKGEEGTPHLQGYIEFRNGKTISAIHKLSGFERAWLKERKGTPKEAADYCKKDGKFYERGTISEQGKRTELQSVTDDVQDGISLDDIAMDHPETWIKYHKGITSLWNIVNVKHRNDDKKKIVWIFGKSGVGKTLHAFQKGGYVNSYIKDGTCWWDGYCGQENIIIDDFDGHWPYRDLLRLLDRYPYQGQIKGGYVRINSNIIITCEFPPEYFWKNNELKQITRRLDKIYWIKEMGKLEEPDQLERHKYALECELEKKNQDFPMR